MTESKVETDRGWIRRMSWVVTVGLWVAVASSLVATFLESPDERREGEAYAQLREAQVQCHATKERLIERLRADGSAPEIEALEATADGADEEVERLERAWSEAKATHTWWWPEIVCSLGLALVVVGIVAGFAARRRLAKLPIRRS